MYFCIGYNAAIDFYWMTSADLCTYYKSYISYFVLNSFKNGGREGGGWKRKDILCLREVGRER